MTDNISVREIREVLDFWFPEDLRSAIDPDEHVAHWRWRRSARVFAT